MQAPMYTQSVQQVVPTHVPVPPRQPVPNAAVVVVQTPELEHLGCLQVGAEGHFLHAAPLSPQLLVEVPPRQELPERHPLQHAPPAHWPVLLSHVLPLLLLVLVQPPLLHAFTVQSLPSLQFLHWAPFLPHLEVAVPARQVVVPLQHPLHSPPWMHWHLADLQLSPPTHAAPL